MKLVCPECRKENEPERLYCHDCGTRLDRSVLAKEKPKEEDPKETQRRVAAMFSQSRAKMRMRFFQGSKLVLGALLVAVIVQMLRPPDVPERPKAAPFSSAINLELENAAMDPRSPALHYTDEQVNAYLAYTLKGKQAALSKYLQFERVIVDFEEGYGNLTVERSLSGYPLFTSATFVATIKDANLVFTSRGGHIGRMPIHPALMQYANVLFADVEGALERERKSIVKLGAIEIHPKMVILSPKAVPQT
ncbi:MAG: zinc ribbon domain-containing protein [Verrucomicrobiota bacterium]|nr:zinc ribbon domain-containing protein [Verrucomicrobiota bacterium]